jgi:hypothetical protein
MVEKLKEMAGMALGFLILVAVLSLPLVFIMGASWASENLLGPLIVIGWILLAINMVILLPLSIFKRLRGFSGGGIFFSSFVFGLVAWLLGFILTYSIWGGWAVFVGILFLGGGVVPIALLATAISGYWDPFFTLLAVTIITFAVRVIGIIIAESGE